MTPPTIVGDLPPRKRDVDPTMPLTKEPARAPTPLMKEPAREPMPLTKEPARPLTIVEGGLFRMLIVGFFGYQTKPFPGTQSQDMFARGSPGVTLGGMKGEAFAPNPEREPTLAALQPHPTRAF